MVNTMVINYELIIIIYLILTIVSFYPIIYQLIIISMGRNVHDRSKIKSTNSEIKGRVFLVIPVKSEPLDLVEASMKRLASLQSGLNVIYILDNYDDNTLNIVRAMGNRYGFRIIHREKPSGYKGGALNHVIKRIEAGPGDYMLVLDIDSVISQEAINELIRHAGSAGAVVPHWVVSNKDDSLLARGQWIGYLFFFRVLRALNELIGWVPILGSGSLVSIGALKRVGYWPEDVLEDVELGVRFFINDLRVAYVDNALTNVEVPVNYVGFLRQQLRWSFGVGRVIRKYLWQVMRRKHGTAVLLYLGQYSAYVLQLISILMLAAMNIAGIGIPPWAFITLLVIVVPSLLMYLYSLLMLDREFGGDPRRDIFAINSANLAFIMALPRIAAANLMGLLNVGRIKWIPTPKGSRKWAREGINLFPEYLMTTLIITAFILSIVHLELTNILITLPYLAGYVRGLWRILNGTL
ncbi:glycosyltransferase family 2 protein [Vulcanisaeta sp. JCM 16161]|uniref:glycosyltransferase family 2 protein n=1 Tax=Vulcanisaeta sp. JCM 16161 TaxID=1295372 RepID=UPI0006D00939|nr:glycosyltransferase family 2 protein [Vulcanisaeta sp. JCM 16161]